MHGYSNYDAENGFFGMENAFSDKAIRRGFIQKVYGILAIQLTVTAAIVGTVLLFNEVKDFVKQNSYLYYVSFGIVFICIIALSCCESVRRKSPANFIFLGIFTCAQGFMCAVFSAGFETEAVLIALGITALITVSLSLFAFQTKIDFTTCGGMLCCLTAVLLFSGILMIFLPYNKYAMIGYGAAGALIFSLYIIYDTQLMMGGEHKYSLDPEEYIFAALNLYLDIINLFLYILTIVGLTKD